MKTYRLPRELLAEVAQALAAKPPLASSDSILDKVSDLLQRGRHYLWTSVYLAVGNELIQMGSAGPEAHCARMAFGSGLVGRAAQTGTAKVVADVTADPDYRLVLSPTRSELVMPIKIASRVLGVINVESDSLNAFGQEDRVLLKEVATQLSRFLTGHGKYVLMKARELASTPSHSQPEPAPDRRRAAAGEKHRS